MELIDNSGNVFGESHVQIIGPDGKPKTTGGGGGGAPTGPAGGDLTGTYPNPGVNWSLGSPVYDLLYYPLLSNPASYLTSAAAASTYYPLTNPSGYISFITSGDVTTALGYTPVNKAGDTMLGNLILNADPTVALGAATKQYVDNISAGINFHSPVHAATTVNLVATYFNGVAGVGATLTATSPGALVVDSQPMANTERVLVWQQSSGIENGIYDVTDAGSPTTPFILTRSADADNSPVGEIAYGDFTLTITGTLYGGFGFIMNTTGTVTIGVTNISYVQYNIAQAVTAGYGLQELTPNVLSVDPSVIATVASLSSYLTSATAATTYFPIPTGTISQYLRGDGSLATFPTIPSVTPSALTEVDDTNVTLTLSGTPSTALLQPVTITAGWTGTLDDSRITSATTWNNKSRLQYNNSTGSQSITSNTVTYLTGSAITTANIKAGTVVTWNISITKTAAGTQAPLWTVRFGTAATTADATLLSFTAAGQTAAIDTAMVTIQCTFRTVGSGTSAVLVGHYSLVHQLATTGFSTGQGGAFATSAGFNSTTASAFLGVTCNSGTTAVWTVNQVNVKIENIL